MPKDFGGDVSNSRVGFHDPAHGRGDGSRVPSETAERFFFAEEKLRLSGAQRIHQRAAVGAARFPNDEGDDDRGDEADEVQLLRLQRLLADDEEESGDDRSGLAGDAVN